jgi:alkaline phosphatase D
MIDGRQYRSREACYRPPDKGGAHVESDASCPERLDANRSLLGAAQEAWLYDGFARSSARWNVIAGDVLMAQWRWPGEPGEAAFSTDDWNGYPAARTRLLNRLREGRVSNPVTLAGDMHSFWANELKLDFDDPSSPTIATEFVCTSITAIPPPYEAFVPQLPQNPHVRFFESRMRGYASVVLDRAAMTTRFKVLSDPLSPTSPISTLKTFVVEDGKAGSLEA